MTAAIHRSTPLLSVPPTQNTAPVLEFACLYTHDLRKKTKRWNDGFLRYHTFNKRMMLYDIPRNHIGGQHWTGEEDIQEGDEVFLEKVGVKVEVAEQTGTTETDLSELRAKKVPPPRVEPRKIVARTDSGAVASSIVRASSGAVARGNTQLKHRSLNALLGTPKGTLGKAVLPTKSPFEERHAIVENEEWEGGRPAKKARVNEKKPPRSAKQDDMPLWAPTADRKMEQPQQTGDKVFIDLSDDVTPSNDFLSGFLSDALAPSSLIRAAARDNSGISSSPAFQTRQYPAMVARQTPSVPHMQELDHESVSDTTVPKRGLDKSRKSPELARQPSLRGSRPLSSRPSQTLRLAASAPKKRMLFCQDQLTKQRPQRTSFIDAETNTEKSIAVNTLVNDRPMTAKERVQQRVESIRRKKNGQGAPLAAAAKKTISTEAESDHRRAKISNRNRAEPNKSHETMTSDMPAYSERVGQLTSHEVSAMELGRLDRMMLPPAAPSRAPTPPVPAPSPREVRPLRRVISEPPTRPHPKAIPDQSKNVFERSPEAPVRYTPTPSSTKRSREPTLVQPAEKEARAPFKSKAKKNLQKSVSLNITSAGTSTVILGRPFQALDRPQVAKSNKPEPPPEDVGPWSREAFDLFKWRPPGWDEEKWCVVESVAGEKTLTAPVGLSGGASLPGCLEEKGA